MNHRVVYTTISYTIGINYHNIGIMRNEDGKFDNITLGRSDLLSTFRNAELMCFDICFEIRSHFLCDVSRSYTFRKTFLTPNQHESLITDYDDDNL